MQESNGFNQLLKSVAGMLHPDTGDSWLQQQSWQRIVQYSQEEMCELMDAVKQDEPEAILDELADVCFHLAIYTALYMIMRVIWMR